MNVPPRGLSEMARVGILGLGKMGSAFATNLLSKRNEVHVYNRSKDRLRGLIAKGAVAHPSPIELGKSVDVVITSLPDQNVVDSMIMGDNGALRGMKKGALWIEMSTIDPDASIRQAEQAKRAGVQRVDAPVIGNPDMAAKGDYTPLFTVNMLLKDLNLVENQATRQKVALPAGSLAKQLFTTSVNQGQGEMDFSSIAVTLQKLNGIPPPA